MFLDQQSAIYELTPGASAASELLSKGLSLSQLYAEHLTATDKLIKVEEENSRLTRYIDQILQVINYQWPLVQKNKCEAVIAVKKDCLIILAPGSGTKPFKLLFQDQIVYPQLVRYEMW